MKLQLLRPWATPLTIGSFMLMACTGVLMFFHLDSGLNKLAHEWLGWVMVAGVVLHVSLNWMAFKRHLSLPVPRMVLLACAVVLAGSFLRLDGSGVDPREPIFLTLRAVTTAPLAKVAPLTGRSVEQLLADLRGAGIELSDGSQSVASVVGKDRAREGRALAVLFGGKGNMSVARPAP